MFEGEVRNVACVVSADIEYDVEVAGDAISRRRGRRQGRSSSTP
jgi:hypothetical protein